MLVNVCFNNAILKLILSSAAKDLKRNMPAVKCDFENHFKSGRFLCLALALLVENGSNFFNRQNAELTDSMVIDRMQVTSTFCG